MKYKIITSIRLQDYLGQYGVWPQFEENEMAYYELNPQLSFLLERYTIEYALKNIFEN